MSHDQDTRCRTVNSPLQITRTICEHGGWHVTECVGDPAHKPLQLLHSHAAHGCTILAQRFAQPVHTRATETLSFLKPDRGTSEGNRVRSYLFQESYHQAEHSNVKK